MQISTINGRGRVLQSQLFLNFTSIEHYSSLKETINAEDGIWMPKQVHGDSIVNLQESSTPVVEADATICQIPGQWIGIRTADCVPVLVYDPITQTIAAIHAGWRGTVRHIVQQTIEKMKQEYGCKGQDLYAMVGPSISPESFEVGEEVVEEFHKANRAECVIKFPNAKSHIDLWQSNVMDLLDSGLELDQIDCTPICTFQNSNILYSARKEGINTGRNITAIRLQH